MRKKTYDVLLRLDEAERDHLKEQVALSGFNTTQYLRGLIANEKMRPRPPNEYAEIRRQLAAIGNNINQIARAVNARGFARQEDIDAVASAQREIWQMMKRL
ncbi:MAG: MobC family plasmid mobilization relaxosome protein [Oscillospiraceae bacterium]|nr:MobC family plasmid mobilization relaxosome protein [Oscillospiraceae bacterium]